jgi:carbon storage regulator
MLVLSRKLGESIVISGDIRITVSSVQGGRVKLCIDAPRERRVLRAEVCDQQTAGRLPPSERRVSASSGCDVLTGQTVS